MAVLPIAKTEDLTDSQKAQHLAVLTTASFNLANVIDALQTLDNAIYDEALDCLDSARVTINELQGIKEADG